MASIRTEVMVMYLKHRARHYDKATFNAWMYEQISTAECIRQFRQHNDITERMPILEEDFVEWLWSLGYRRQKDGKSKAVN